MEKTRLFTFIIILTLMPAMATSCFVQSASAQSSTIIKAETPSTTASVGKAFIVTITLTNVQNLYGVEVTLKWNPTILQATNIDVQLGVESHANGVLHDSSNSPPIFIAENNFTQNGDEYILTATSMAPALPFSGSGNIVKITFNPISIGNSALDLESQLYDYPPTDRDPRVSLPIQHTTQDSFVTVTQTSNTQSPTTTPATTPTSTLTPSPSTTAILTPTFEPTATPTASPYSSPALTETPKQHESNPDNTTILFLAALAIAVLAIAIGLFIRRQKRPITPA